jgi:hypothetical protein
MKYPLYKVGDHVYFISRLNPELNGEYTIRAVHRSGDRYIDRVAKKPTQVQLNTQPFAYRFAQVVPNRQGNYEALVCEFQLRMKYEPATVSFKRLLELV